MLKPEYKRDVNQNYLILHMENEIDTESYQIRMLMTNTVPGLLPCRLQSVDNQVCAFYEITSRQQLTSVCDGKKLSYADLQLIFGGFVHVMEAMAEYLLNPDMLIIHPDYMYTDPGQKEMFFCCLPGYSRQIRIQFQELTEYILPGLDHEDARAVMLGYGVYRRAMDDTFHLEQIKEELYKYREPPADTRTGLPPVSGPAAVDQSFMASRFPDEAQRIRSTQDPLSAPVFSAELSPADHKALRDRSFLWQVIGVCLSSAALAGCCAARYLGYLPDIPTAAILGAGVILMGLSVLISRLIAGKKEKKGQTVLDELMAGQKERIPSPPMPDPEADLAAKASSQAMGRLDIREAFSPSAASERESQDPFNSFGKTWDIRSALGHFEKNDESHRPESLSPSRNPESSETVVLTAALKTGPASLVSREPGELATIYLSEELTVIGKLANAADAVIDMPTVSRIHAKVRRRDGEYYLTDLNSRNGTSVNGKILHANEDCLLNDQDEVDFAQARYIFLK